MLTRRTLLALSALPFVGRAAHAAADRRVVVSVLTCPRPRGVSYIDGLLDAIESSLPGVPRVIVADIRAGRAPAPRPGWPQLLSGGDPRIGGRVDNKQPGWVAIGYAAQLGADLLFLEDDVRPLSAGALREMIDHQVPGGCAFTSFFHRARKPGLYEAGTFDMSQSVLIPAQSLPALLRFGERKPFEWQAVTGVDLAIAAAARLERWRYELTAPKVAHIGKVSAVAPGEARPW